MSRRIEMCKVWNYSRKYYNDDLDTSNEEYYYLTSLWYKTKRKNSKWILYKVFYNKYDARDEKVRIYKRKNGRVKIKLIPNYKLDKWWKKEGY